MIMRPLAWPRVCVSVRRKVQTIQPGMGRVRNYEKVKLSSFGKNTAVRVTIRDEEWKTYVKSNTLVSTHMFTLIKYDQPRGLVVRVSDY